MKASELGLTTHVPALRLAGLRAQLESGEAIVEGIDLGLAPGEILGIVGESGAGKSTVALALLGYSKDGTKPRAAVEKEIEIYRETLKVTKTFTPDDLEDMSLLRKVQSR